MSADCDFISRRALAVDASGIRKVFDLAAKSKTLRMPEASTAKARREMKSQCADMSDFYFWRG